MALTPKTQKYQSAVDRAKDSANPYSTTPSHELQKSIAEFTATAERKDLPSDGPSREMYRHVVALCEAELSRRGIVGDEAAVSKLSPLTDQKLSLPSAASEVPPQEAQRPPPLRIPPGTFTFEPISQMDANALKQERPVGTITPAVSPRVGFLGAPLRIPVSSGTIQALSLDPEINKKLRAERTKRYAPVEEAPHNAPKVETPTVEIELPVQLGNPLYLPAPIGSTVTEYCGEELLSLPQSGEYGVLVKGGYEDAAYHISRSAEPRTVPLDMRSTCAPSIEEMRYWQAALPLPSELRQALVSRLASHDPAIRDEVFDLVTSYMSSKNEHGEQLFSYVCHRAVGELLRQQGDDLPFVLSELKIGHCDYLAWYTCALLRGYGVPAWITSEFFPTKSGDAFNGSYGHARVLAWSFSKGTEQLFDPTTSADLGRGWLPEVLPDTKVREWGLLLQAATTYEEKRPILRAISEDVAKRASTPEAAAAARQFYGTLTGGLLSAISALNLHHVSDQDLGAPNLRSAGQGAWQLLRNKEALATLREIGRYFEDKNEGEVSTEDLIKGLASVGRLALNLSSFETGLVHRWLEALHILRRPIAFSLTLSDQRLFAGIDFPGPQPAPVDSLMKRSLKDNNIVNTLGSYLFETPYILRQRHLWTPNLHAKPFPGSEIELPPHVVVFSHENPLKLNLKKHIVEVTKSVDLPLCHLSRELIERHLGAIDRKKIGEHLKRHGFYDWSYFNSRIEGESNFGEEGWKILGYKGITNLDLLRGLLTYQVDLQRALASSHKAEKTKLLDEYNLTHSDFKRLLAHSLHLDTSRPRRLSQSVKPKAESIEVFNKYLQGFVLDAVCQARVRGVFSSTLKSLNTTWAPQKMKDHGEIREYAVGDDVRYIDWKTTARRDSVHVKLAHTHISSPENQLTVMVDMPLGYELRNVLQINQIITECKSMARRGRTVLLSSLQSDTYIEITPRNLGIPNASLLAALDQNKGAGTEVRPGIKLARPKHADTPPQNVVLVGASFERLLALRALFDTESCKPIWLDAQELDVFPLARVSKEEPSTP